MSSRPELPHDPDRVRAGERPESDPGVDLDLWAAVGGDLPESRREQLARELERDAVRARRAAEARALQELLPLYRAPRGGAEFTERVLAAARDAGLVSSPWHARRVSLPLPLVLAAAAIVALALPGAWLLLSRRSPETPETSPSVAREERPAPRGGPAESPLSETAEFGPRRGFGPRVIIGAAGNAAGLFDLEIEDELFPPLEIRQEVTGGGEEEGTTATGEPPLGGGGTAGTSGSRTEGGGR